jgi:hypothetical protein
LNSVLKKSSNCLDSTNLKLTPPTIPTKNYLSNQVTYHCVATLSQNGVRKKMNSSDKILNALQQNGKGLRAVDLAKERKLSRSTIHRHLSSLQLQGKVEEKNGLWYAKQNSQNLDPIKAIFGELENLTLKIAEFKNQIYIIDEYNPENIDPEFEIAKLKTEIEELEELKNNLITQFKLSFNNK